MTTRLTSALIAVATPLMFAAVAGGSVALANTYFTRSNEPLTSAPRLMQDVGERVKPDCIRVRHDARNEPESGEQF